MVTQSLVGRFEDARGMATLDLRSDGRFSYAGVWSGYESTLVEGTWSQRAGYLFLTGAGSMRSCTQRFSERPFEAIFSTQADGSVVSVTGAPEWSLLATKEPLLPISVR